MKTDRGVNATATTASHGAYLDLGSGDKILNGFKGAQNENLYLGTYDGKPVKWRVLAVNDATYGGSAGNNLLLFADYSLGSSSFTGASAVGVSTAAQKFANPDGYYGTSKVRAYMNGGYYLTSATSLGASVAESDSLAYKLLSDLNSDLLTLTNTTTYVGRRMTPAGTSPGIRTLGNDLAKSMANASQWTDWTLNSNTSAQIGGAAINTKTGTTGNNNSATNFSNLATNGIVHTTYNDKLFLLSYDDLMRADYGFADENGIYLDQGLFAKVASSVANYKENGYRAGYIFSADAMLDKYVEGWPQDPYESTNPYPKSFAEYLSGSDNVDYWIRNTIVTRAASDTAALCVWSNHVDWAFTYADSSAGVRPASLLNASKIGYVTPASIGANFASASAFTTDKPEYKLFVKDNDMGENSKKAKALYSVSGNTLKLSYNNPTGKTSGNLTVLISDKTKSDGSVLYQAAKAISASASVDHYVTESFTLPSGIDMSNYNVSVLFTSDTSGNYTSDGANATETIYASYTVSNGIPAPQDINGLEYDGKCKWIGSLGDKAPDWVITDIYCNSSYMTVEKIMYTGVGEDAEEEDVTDSGTSAIINAGKYVITMKLASGQTWSGTDPTDDKTFTINVGQKKSTVKPKKKDGEPEKIPFDSAGLPELIQDEGGTAGTFTWDEGEEATAGTKKYKWTFTPESDNYTTEHGEMELTYIGREMTGISATFDTEKAATTPIYTSTSDDLLKTYIVVTATYSDGKSGTITTYKFEIDTIDGKLEEGDNTLIITTNDDSQTCELTIPDVIAVVVDKINSVTLETKEFTYPVTADDIKEKITAVNVHWNDNKSGKMEDLTDVTVSGTLNAGAKVTITIGIDGTELTKTVDIKINQGEYKIDKELFKDKSATYTGSAFDPEGWIDEDELPDGVTVTYTCDDWVSLGDHTVTAKFSHSNANYKAIDNMTAKLTISNKPAHDMTGTEFKPEAGGGLTSDGKGGYTGTYSPDGG
ncbi:MAG: hypothetical protein K2O44_05310, partial [Clostridia bacterium]|nr:hypothetical protein [Clostridia bacterium]